MSKLIASFTLNTENGPLYGEIRLNHADDGTEILQHFENDTLRFVHPARRCTSCTEIITADSIATRCIACADLGGLNL